MDVHDKMLDSVCISRRHILKKIEPRLCGRVVGTAQQAVTVHLNCHNNFFVEFLQDIQIGDRLVVLWRDRPER